jgi:hypothetical protein
MPRGLSAVARPAAFLVAGLAMLCAFACESPTLPLPPPEAPMQSPGVDADHIELRASCGGAQPGANIFIINQTIENNTALMNMAVGGSIANPCGAWNATVFAHTGDVLSILQEAGTEASEATIYTVR